MGTDNDNLYGYFYYSNTQDGHKCYIKFDGLKNVDITPADDNLDDDYVMHFKNNDSITFMCKMDWKTRLHLRWLRFRTIVTYYFKKLFRKE